MKIEDPGLRLKATHSHPGLTQFMSPIETESGAQSAGQRRSDARWTILAAATIILTGLLAYSNSFDVPFVFDDVASIRDNASIRRLWPIWPVFFTSASPTVVGRPLLNLSLALNYAWGGAAVRGYHVVNLAIHLWAALCFGVAATALSSCQCSPNASGKTTPAWRWPLHPLGRPPLADGIRHLHGPAHESMLGVFYFTMLYCVIRGESSRRRTAWYCGAILACWAGTATKEVMATGPIVLLAYDRIFLCSSFREIASKRGGLYLALCASWALLAGLMLSSGRHSELPDLASG